MTVTITEAAAFHLVADPAIGGGLQPAPLPCRRRLGRSQADSCGVPVPGSGSGVGSKAGVSLGMPALPVRRA